MLLITQWIAGQPEHRTVDVTFLSLQCRELNLSIDVNHQNRVINILHLERHAGV